MAKEQAKAKQEATTNKVARTITYIAKKDPGLHQLRRLELLGSEVTSDTLLHEDTPAIVAGKYRLELYKAKYE